LQRTSSKTKRGHFEPDQLKDEYESVLKQADGKKQRGERI
jgi:hypothetical protein